MRDLPVACSLSAAELSARRQGLLPGLLTEAASRAAIADGYRFTFAPTPGLLEGIARVLDAERLCCRFLRFQLVVEQDGAPITLDVTGPQGTKEFIADLIGSGTGGTEVPPYVHDVPPDVHDVPPHDVHDVPSDVPSTSDSRRSAESE